MPASTFNTLPVNVKFNATPWLMDGGKRDRALWSGDLTTAGRTLMLSLGTVGTPYVLGSLTAFGSNQAPDGSMPGNVGFFGPLFFYYSVAYSMYYTLAVADYYRGPLGIPAIGEHGVHRTQQRHRHPQQHTGDVL